MKKDINYSKVFCGKNDLPLAGLHRVSGDSAVLRSCKNKSLPLLKSEESHTTSLSSVSFLHTHTHTHLHTLSTLSQKFHSSSNLSAGRGGAVGGQGSRQDTHTSARTANTVKNKYSPLTDL